ncbi:MAG: cell division protein FtsL [Bacilli bacterium]
MQKTKKVRVLKGEKMMWLGILIMFLIIPITSVYTKATLSESNIKVEKVRANIDNQKNTNESLNMKISELASLDKIQEVANEYGMTYNNDNIKVVATR